MKNLKLKIKNGSVDEKLECGERPMKSGLNDGGAGLVQGVDGVVLAVGLVADESRKKAKCVKKPTKWGK
jgi:hypothetical protein